MSENIIIAEFLKTLNLTASPKELEEISLSLQKRIEQVTVKTLLANLSLEQSQIVLKALQENPANIEIEVSKIAATIPRLWDKINVAIDTELEEIKGEFGDIVR
jgi:hypothetical protein